MIATGLLLRDGPSPGSKSGRLRVKAVDGGVFLTGGYRRAFDIPLMLAMMSWRDEPKGTPDLIAHWVRDFEKVEM